ncbi:hypothetical protein BHE74_00012540, partial [Ensete ventricosum]
LQPQSTPSASRVRRSGFAEAEISDPTRARGKLAPNWEGPYKVIDVVRDGTYMLATTEGKLLPRIMTHIQLKKILHIKTSLLSEK